MNKITKDSVAAFLDGKKFKRGNMVVAVNLDWVGLYQHGNLIADYNPSRPLDTLELSNCGWYSVTTKERLDAILYAVCGWHLSSVKGEWVLRTSKHGEERPFRGTVRVRDLIDLNNLIAKEKAERKAA